MNWQMIFAGFGGQGIMFMGQLLAYAAMKEEKNTSWIPSYGPEMRGGTANCSVVVSDKTISSPIVSKPDIIVAMNLPSLLKFESTLKPGGHLILNSSLVTAEPTRSDINIIKIPANDIAEKLGSGKVANIVVLGAILGITKIVTSEGVLSSLEKINPKIKGEILEINKKAITAGMEFVK